MAFFVPYSTFQVYLSTLKTANAPESESIKAKNIYLTTSEKLQNNFWKVQKACFLNPNEQNTGKYQL